VLNTYPFCSMDALIYSFAVFCPTCACTHRSNPIPSPMALLRSSAQPTRALRGLPLHPSKFWSPSLTPQRSSPAWAMVSSFAGWVGLLPCNLSPDTYSDRLVRSYSRRLPGIQDLCSSSSGCADTGRLIMPFVCTNGSSHGDKASCRSDLACVSIACVAAPAVV